MSEDVTFKIMQPRMCTFMYRAQLFNLRYIYVCMYKLVFTQIRHREGNWLLNQTSPLTAAHSSSGKK